MVALNCCSILFKNVNYFNDIGVLIELNTTAFLNPKTKRNQTNSIKIPLNMLKKLVFMIVNGIVFKRSQHFSVNRNFIKKVLPFK